jgi:hypothetical protein
MKIREGAYYRTRSGDVVGPVRLAEAGSAYPVLTHTACWRADGRFSGDDEHRQDLISEVYVSDTPAPETKTLRDEFAMAALQGMLASEAAFDRNMAEYAYEYADAMMEERKK